MDSYIHDTKIIQKPYFRVYYKGSQVTPQQEWQVTRLFCPVFISRSLFSFFIFKPPLCWLVFVSLLNCSPTTCSFLHLLPYTSLLEKMSEIRRKLVIVGDGACGKVRSFSLRLFESKANCLLVLYLCLSLLNSLRHLCNTIALAKRRSPYLFPMGGHVQILLHP